MKDQLHKCNNVEAEIKLYAMPRRVRVSFK